MSEFAVGDCRRYTLPEVMQEHYSSVEVGASLAAAIKSALAAPAPAHAAAGAAEGSSSVSSRLPAKPGQLPPLRQGKVLGCRLPGGYVFAFAGCPAAVAHPALAPPAGGRSLISRGSSSGAAGSASEAGGTPADAAVVNICLDGDDIVHHVAYLGPGATAAAKLAGLVGLPFSYLAQGLQLPAKKHGVPVTGVEDAVDDAAGLAGGLQLVGAAQQQSNVSMKGVPGVSAGPEPGVYVLEQDMLAQLSQPWAQLLFHDGLDQLRQQLKQQCSTSGQGSANVLQSSGSNVGRRVQAGLAQLLQRCGAELHGCKLVAAAGAPAAISPAAQ